MNEIIVSPSSQVDSTLPLWISNPGAIVTAGGVVTEVEGITEGPFNKSVTRKLYRNQNHENFVNFMQKSAESEERFGFGQDILQNLLKYRDFNSYEKQVITHSYLDAQEEVEILTIDEEEVIKLTNGYGFPDKDGVILIDDEVILYRRKEGDFLYELQRGVSGTTLLPTFKHGGKYVYTEPAKHLVGAKVFNLSVMFMVAILDQIHNTYAHGINSQRVVPEVNRSSLLKNIKDFFRAKGSKLGIKALFKILFAENDVDVFYPGDRMIIPSESTFVDPLLVRVTPIPQVFCDPEENYTLPDTTIGSEIIFKSFLSDELIASGHVDYVTSYQVGEYTQYEYTLNKSTYNGEILSNPTTVITGVVERDDVMIDVESTYGFPDEGVIFIDNEAIYYYQKTDTQFQGCRRGYVGVAAFHNAGTFVHGPYYVETRIIDKEGEEYVSRAWTGGMACEVKIEDPGLLNDINDEVVVTYGDRRDSKFFQYDPKVKLRITGVTDGSISEIVIQEALPSNSRVGDFMWFDESDTTGGGAQAIVSLIEGDVVNRSIGVEITSTVSSHQLQISPQLGDNPSYTFVKDSIIDTVGTVVGEQANISRFRVDEYDYSNLRIDASVLSNRLVGDSDIYYDSRVSIVRSSFITVVDEPVTKKLLFVDDTDHFLKGDKVGVSSTDETLLIQKIQPNISMTVQRGYESTPSVIRDTTILTNRSRYLYFFEIGSTENSVQIGDIIYVEGSDNEEINGKQEVVDVNNTGFFIYTTQLYGMEIGLSYKTTSLTAQGVPSEIKVTSPGYGYNKLPICVGLYKKEIDRADTRILFSTSKITGVEVLSGGARYVSPTAIFYDLQGEGSGATADVVVEGGRVTEINVTNPGENYVDPYLVLVEESGKYVCLTEDIGKITSVEVVDPGRFLSVDPNLQPDISVPTRIVVRFVVNTGTIFVGDTLLQGNTSGVVSDYDHDRQLVTLVDVVGEFEYGKFIYSDSDAVFEILSLNNDLFSLNESLFATTDPNRSGTTFPLLIGNAKFSLVVCGAANPAGRFIDDKSKLSEYFPVIQDSYRYQWFSYLISSPMQKVDYDTFVEDIIHPAGFVKFADVTIHSSTSSTFDTSQGTVLIIEDEPEFKICYNIDGGVSITYNWEDFLDGNFTEPVTDGISGGTAFIGECTVE